MKMVRFTVDAPGAKKVFLAGDFTDWEENARPMRRSKPNSAFIATIELPEGTYQYKYIIDGNWVEDPAAESVTNHFGTRNSVLTVGSATRKRKAA